MILLSVRDVSRQFDAEPVFRDVCFDVRDGERIGLVGPNGTGKTTLLNVLVGIDHADTGEVERPQSVDISLLKQVAEFDPEQTLLEEAQAGLAHLYELQDEAHDLAEKMAAETDPTAQEKIHRRYDQLQHELDRLDAYNIDHRVDEVLHGLGFTSEEYDQPLTQFSGGQQNRVLLARMLLRAPDVMLLDEPTNHLDIAATEWLEDYLVRSRQAFILVSHDRYFLDRVTNRILELYEGTLTDYPGNFSAYWSQREERNKVLERTFEKQQDFISKTEDFIRRNKYGQKHAQASDRVKKLNRIERVDRPRDFDTLSMSFGEAARTGDWVIDAVGLEKGFGTPLFTDFNLRIHRGDRVAILGPNGSGKTTLLRTLIGELTPDAGTSRLGTGVEIGYYDQQMELLDPKLDAVDSVRPPHDHSYTPGTCRSLLARFGLQGEMVFQKVGSMSGGERSKVALARLAARNVNLLVLDEPTNHLDLWACDALEQALKFFDGTLLFVSHDRYFIDRVAQHVIVLEPDRWWFYEGNYSDYGQFRKNRELEPQPDYSNSDSKNPPSSQPAEQDKNGGNQSIRRKRKFPYRKINEIEADIAGKEAVIEQLQADLADPEVHRDGDRIKEVTQRYDETKSELERLYEHWEEATELN